MINNLDIKSINGLSSHEAESKLREDGPNELPSGKKRSLFIIILEVVREPMFLMLVSCGLLYLFLGDIEEALMLLGFVFVVMGITFYQERKTERALEALRDLSSPRALVIREGIQKRIAGREVVRDDILILKEGDRVPADAAILSCINLLANESLLTGESVSVRKVASHGNEAMARPGGDDQPFVYSGTLIVQGQGIAKVQATGDHTEIGRIGKALLTVEPEETLLKKETGRLVRRLSLVGLSLCILVVIIFGLTRGSWTNGFLAGITLAMAILPEEFPVVLTVFLALGAWRMSRRQVLTRRVPAIETLGSTTVLCVDKTGTLTLNSMSVRNLFTGGEFLDIKILPDLMPEKFHELMEFSILASQIDPFDPMEQAIKSLGEKYLAQTEHLHHNWTLVHEYPLSRELLSLSRVWKSQSDSGHVIAAKGAPEAIAELCHFDESRNKELNSNIDIMAKNGLRVLGVASARLAGIHLPELQHDFDFEFLGLIGLADPIRPSVPDAVKECYMAGIRVVMITGDYPGTAQNIAEQIGLISHEQVITGPELDKMSDLEVQTRLKTINIFARVVPEQKLRLVNAFKANGEIVAMTGDGVNDAPALKSAHIGIAMGERGTDVARESSALVLLNDDFSSIVQAVKMGRRIYDNIKKAIAYIFAIHVPIAGLSLIPVIFKWPLVLLPVHVVFLELIIDPACSVVFEAEPEEANVMNRPPRDPKESLFNRKTLAICLLQGLSVLIIVLAVFGISLYRGQGEMEARALTFTTLIVANLGLILTNRSWTRTIFQTLRSPNPAVWWVLGGAALFLASVLYIPFLRDLFRLSLLHPIDLIICFSAGVFSIIWFEVLKVIRRFKN
jgi:P-type Ca2+ transporter type 2C